ncbi:pre-mRNA-splicing factor CWC2, putative [Plasmodium malariae]|uniref:Pre-mRNA-splicing factor CWC2, putative n=1 Tax=Plasmodium malariae TaxID=5858 RepID=A0A1C3KDQ9_PLAMA|nr:pre-mRNA-splicing factor CWC2, putative [Plasmodium malariae]
MSLKRFFNFLEADDEKGKKKINAKKGGKEETHQVGDEIEKDEGGKEKEKTQEVYMVKNEGKEEEKQKEVLQNKGQEEVLGENKEGNRNQRDKSTLNRSDSDMKKRKKNVNIDISETDALKDESKEDDMFDDKKAEGRSDIIESNTLPSDEMLQKDIRESNVEVMNNCEVKKYKQDDVTSLCEGIQNEEGLNECSEERTQGGGRNYLEKEETDSKVNGKEHDEKNVPSTREHNNVGNNVEKEKKDKEGGSEIQGVTPIVESSSHNKALKNDDKESSNNNILDINGKQLIGSKGNSSDKQVTNGKNLSSYDYTKNKEDYMYNYENSYYNVCANNSGGGNGSGSGSGSGSGNANSNANVDNHANYPYYYNQYYNNMAPPNPFNNNVPIRNNNYNSINDVQKTRKDYVNEKNNLGNEYNMNDNIAPGGVGHFGGAYMPQAMNNYYNMYNYNYVNNSMGNMGNMGSMTNMGNMTNMTNMNSVNYNYYYNMYDYNRGMETDVRPYGYCSLIDKSIELMKKSDKVKEMLKNPARLQVTQEELNKIDYTEGNEQYNIWFGKYVTDKYDKGSKGTNISRFVAKYKCNPLTDTGYTKADKTYTSKQFFCIYFARGCCAYGHNCLYRHRIPNENDEIEFEGSMDIFGREKFSSFKDDMTGVGSFNSDCRTLFIGSLHIKHFNEVHLIEKILYDEFINFGNIDYVRFIPNKNIAFVQFTNRVNAEFAKVAMSDQPIENHSTALTIKWAFELKNQPSHFFNYYNNPYIYNENFVISSTWEQYMAQQHYAGNPMFPDYNNNMGGVGSMHNTGNFGGFNNFGSINSFSSANSGGNASLSAHYKKINDRHNNLNKSLNKIDHMFDTQN